MQTSDLFNKALKFASGSKDKTTTTTTQYQPPPPAQYDPNYQQAPPGNFQYQPPAPGQPPQGQYNQYQQPPQQGYYQQPPPQGQYNGYQQPPPGQYVDPNQQQPAKKEGGGDLLDKGVGMFMKKQGVKTDNKTTEKISDGIRFGFKKLTGKNLPIKDQEMK